MFETMKLQSRPLVAQRLAFSPGELATLSGLSLSTVHRRLAAGEIKFNRSGRRVLIPREELERLVHPQEHAYE